MDMLPPSSAWGSLRREVVAAICCVICFLIDMSMVTEVQRDSLLEFCGFYVSFVLPVQDGQQSVVSVRVKMKGQPHGIELMISDSFHVYIFLIMWGVPNV